MSGRQWQLAKLAALLFFALACGLLLTSLAGPIGVGAQPGQPAPAIFGAGN